MVRSSPVPSIPHNSDPLLPISVNALIFLAPISAFDQVLAEDPRVNRLEDSLLLWRAIVANKLLAHVNIILFLNKVDLLQVSMGFRGSRFIVSLFSFLLPCFCAELAFTSRHWMLHSRPAAH